MLISALKSAFTAIPARMREFDGLMFLVNAEMANTMAAAARPPANAAKGSRKNRSGKKTRKSSTANPAPAFIPIMFPLARSFELALWMSSPERESAKPARTAAKRRGRRSEKNIILLPEFFSNISE